MEEEKKSIIMSALHQCHELKTHLEVGYDAKGDCSDVQGVGYEVYHIPHVVNIFM